MDKAFSRYYMYKQLQFPLHHPHSSHKTETYEGQQITDQLSEYQVVRS